MTVGKHLRAERETRQMTIGDIARRTYIQPRFLQAIDDDNLSVIPESHLRLFVREYAKAIGLEPDPVLELLGVAPVIPTAPAPPAERQQAPPPRVEPARAPAVSRLTPKSAPAPQPEPRVTESRTVIRETAPEPTPAPTPEPVPTPAPTPEPIPTPAPIPEPRSVPSVRQEAPPQQKKAAPVVRTIDATADDVPVRSTMTGIRDRMTAGHEGEVRWSTWLIGAGVILLLLAGVYYVFFRDEHTRTADAPAVVKTDSSGGTSPASSPATIVPLEQNTVTPSRPVSTGGDSLTLEGRATANIWFSVASDGGRTETGTLDSGATKVWRAYKNFRVSLGNAGGLNLYLNGEPLGSLGPKSSTVRNKLIDSAGVNTRLNSPVPSGAPVRRPAATPAPRSGRRPARTPNPATSPAMRPITPTGTRGGTPP